MDWQGWYTIAVVAGTLAAMIRGVAGPDLIMMAGLFALAAVGILTPEETFSGFANTALWAVGVLFIVSAGLREKEWPEVLESVGGLARSWLLITETLEATGSPMDTLPLLTDDYVPVERLVSRLLLKEVGNR